MSAREEITSREPDQATYDQSFSDWSANARWYRRWSARLGLQGKLMLCFMTLLSLGLGASCWMFSSRSTTLIADVMGALAQSSEQMVRSNDSAELHRLSQDLIKSHNILFVGFLDAESRPLALSSR